MNSSYRPQPACARYVKGNTEGTPARARTSTRGQLFSSDPFGLRRFRARGFPILPALPASLLDGKEGVDGSSPSEGLQNPRSRGFFVQDDLLFVARAVGMEPFMELSGPEGPYLEPRWRVNDASLELAARRNVARGPGVACGGDPPPGRARLG